MLGSLEAPERKAPERVEAGMTLEELLSFGERVSFLTVALVHPSSHGVTVVVQRGEADEG